MSTHHQEAICIGTGMGPGMAKSSIRKRPEPSGLGPIPGATHSLPVTAQPVPFPDPNVHLSRTSLHGSGPYRVPVPAQPQAFQPRPVLRNRPTDGLVCSLGLAPLVAPLKFPLTAMATPQQPLLSRTRAKDAGERTAACHCPRDGTVSDPS